MEEFRARHARTNSPLRLRFPQLLLPQEREWAGEWLRSRRAGRGVAQEQESREGSGSGAGEHPSRMGAHPQGWGRAPIKWGLIHRDGGAPPLNGGVPFWKRGSSKSVTMNFNLLIQHTVSRWCSSGCVHEGCGSVHHWLLTDHWVSQIFFYRQPSRQASTPCPHPHAEIAELLMQFLPRPGRFRN